MARFTVTSANKYLYTNPSLWQQLKTTTKKKPPCCLFNLAVMRSISFYWSSFHWFRKVSPQTLELQGQTSPDSNRMGVFTRTRYDTESKKQQINTFLKACSRALPLRGQVLLKSSPHVFAQGKILCNLLSRAKHVETGDNKQKPIHPSIPTAGTARSACRWSPVALALHPTCDEDI